MRRSIRIRLLVWMLAFLVPLAVVAAALLIEIFGNRLLHDIDVALQEEAETVAELLGTPAGPEAVTDLLTRIAGDVGNGSHKYVTVTRSGQLVGAVPPDAASVLAAGSPTLRIARYTSRDGTITVTIGVSAAAALHAKHRLASLLLIGIPLLLALCGAGLWVVTGRALRPLADASRQLEAIAADNLAVRVPIANPYDEVGRMVAVLNRMLDRLQAAVTELQRFTADAAHELRTPLTVLRAGLDVAQSRERPAAEYRAQLGEALTATERLCRLAEDLLTLARLEAGGGVGQRAPVNLGEMLHELAAAWNGEATDGPTVEMRGASDVSVWVSGNAGDLYRLFNNLIDNAVRHASGDFRTSPAVQLSAVADAGSVEAQVADNGPGLSPEDLLRVFDRFYRSNGAHAAPSGAGLGLSIAREIAHAHGGTIRVVNRAGGGCVFTVTLPAAPVPTDLA